MLLQEYIWVIKPQTKYIYTGATARVHMGNQASDKIPVLRGVRQGAINMDGEKLWDLTFADDVALSTEGVKDMEHQLNTVSEESLKMSLKIRKGKTTFITNSDRKDNIQINETEIEKVTN